MDEMRAVRNQGITLATETFGETGNPALLLVMGATASMLGWPDEFCAALAGHGLYVIRFDHRDTGNSTTVASGEASYSVEDLADDAIAILDDYGIGKAHLIGMSLGGYIAQMLAVARPERVSSLTLIASEPLGWDGEALPHISQDFLDHFALLGSLDWSDRKAVKDFLVETQRLCAGKWGEFDHGRESARIEQVLSRTNSIASMFNHGALISREDWTGRFREISCPTLVLHGEADPILPVENGRALAAGISGASLTVLPKIGHELPRPSISAMAGQIARHVRAVRV